MFTTINNDDETRRGRARGNAGECLISFGWRCCKGYDGCWLIGWPVGWLAGYRMGTCLEINNGSNSDVNMDGIALNNLKGIALIRFGVCEFSFVR